MPRLFKRADHWYIEFRDKRRRPYRKTIATTFRKKTAAEHLYARLTADFAKGLYDPWKDAVPREGVTLDKAVERYLAQKDDRRADTLRNDRSLLKRFAGALPAGALVAQVERRHVQAYLARPSLASSTRRTYYTRMRTFFDWAVRAGLTPGNPFDGMAPPKLEKQVAEFITREEYVRLLRTIESDAVLRSGQLKPGEVSWLSDVIQFAVGSGMRLGEICALRWSAVRFDETRPLAHVPVKNRHGFKTKSAHERPLVVAGDAYTVLRRRHAARLTEADGPVFTGAKGAPLNRTYVSKRFKHYARLAGLDEGIRFHSQRHTYASWLAMEGVDIMKIQMLMGHGSITMTQRYSHLAPGVFADDVLRVFAPSGEGMPTPP